MRRLLLALLFALVAVPAVAQGPRPFVVIDGPERITSIITPPQITADEHDYDPTGLSTARIVFVTTDARRTLTGLAAQADGTVLTFVNRGSHDLVLANQHARSAAPNRLRCPGNVDFILHRGAAVGLIYDGIVHIWRVLGF